MVQSVVDIELRTERPYNKEVEQCRDTLWDKLAVGDERKVIIDDLKYSRIQDKPSGECTVISSSFLTQSQFPSYFTALLSTAGVATKEGDKKSIFAWPTYPVESIWFQFSQSLHVEK